VPTDEPGLGKAIERACRNERYIRHSKALTSSHFEHRVLSFRAWAGNAVQANLGSQGERRQKQLMNSNYRKCASFGCMAARRIARAGTAAIAILLALLAVCPGASAEVVISRYAVTLSGIPTGEIFLRAKYNAKQYEIAISGDVGTIIDSTKIEGTASGARAGSKLTPEHFQVTFSGGDQGAIEVNFKGSGGTGSAINPRLRGVFDPLSALLFISLKPVAPEGNPCNHVMPIFTGRSRFELSLRPKEGQTKSVIVGCEADYAATPGQTPEKLDWEIAFTKVPKPHFWLLEHISLHTPKGTVSIDRADTSISDY
jgi:Protein of unknown function (DUF3108)